MAETTSAPDPFDGDTSYSLPDISSFAENSALTLLNLGVQDPNTIISAMRGTSEDVIDRQIAMAQSFLTLNNEYAIANNDQQLLDVVATYQIQLQNIKSALGI